MDNNDAYNSGYDIGNSNGSMPTYVTIRDSYGETAANRAYDGYNDAQTAQGNSTSGK